MLGKIQADVDALVKERNSKPSDVKTAEKPKILNAIIIPLFLLVLGAALIFVLLPLGIALLAAALIFFAIKISAYSKENKKYEDESARANSEEQGRNSAINNAESIIKAFLVSYNCYASGDVWLEFRAFQKRHSRIIKSLKRISMKKWHNKKSG